LKRSTTIPRRLGEGILLLPSVGRLGGHPSLVSDLSDRSEIGRLRAVRLADGQRGRLVAVWRLVFPLGFLEPPKCTLEKGRRPYDHI